MTTRVVQSAGLLHGSSSSQQWAAGTRTVTLPSPCTPGNLLTVTFGFDKTVTAHPEAPAGWARAVAYVQPSVSQAVYWRIADGTATDQTFTYTTAATRGSMSDFTEWQFKAGGTPDVLVGPNSDSGVTSVTLTGTASVDGLSMTFLSVDSFDAPMAGLTYTNGYEAEVARGGMYDNGGSCVAVSSRLVTAGTDKSTTVNMGGKNDQAVLSMLTFAPASGDGNPPIPAEDTIAPTVDVTAPTQGSTVGGSFVLQAAATDNIGVYGVSFSIDGGATLRATLNNGVWQSSVDLTAYTAGSHTITATAVDAAGNSATSNTVTFTVDNTVPPVITNAWSGGVTPDGFTVAIKANAPCKLHISTSSTLTNSTVTAEATPDADGALKIKVTGLTAATEYFWGVEIGGTVSSVHQGRVRTGKIGPHSFSFWHSSCALTGSNHVVFEQIANRLPDFGLHMGDIHYENINANSPAAYHNGYDKVFLSARQSNLYRKVPTEYMWDDHDYGPDGSGATSPGRPAAITSFRQRVPSVELPSAEGIYRTWVTGRVRFVLLDVRAYRTGSTLIGAEQKTWLKNLLDTATEAALVITTSTPWMGSGGDSWGGYQTERLELAEHMVASGWQGRIIMIGGDQHGISFDDGSHNVWGGLYAPIMQTAALDQSGSNKGGTYTVPVSEGGGRYGVTTVTDDGGDITFTMNGYIGETTYFAETYTVAAPEVVEPVYASGWHVYDRAVSDWVPIDSGAVKTAVPVGGPDGVLWAPLHMEEFTGSKADLLAGEDWSYGWYEADGATLSGPANGNENSLYDRDQFAITDGVAQFTVGPNTSGKSLNGYTPDNLGANLMGTGMMFGYGYMEARIQQVAGDESEGLWPGFWLNGWTRPADMEIDVMEGDGTDSYAYNIHWDQQSGELVYMTDTGYGHYTLPPNTHSYTVEGSATGFHTYGVDVRADGIDWYIDGAKIGSYTGTVPAAERFPIIGLSTYGIVPQPKTMLVEYVRIWQRA